MIVGQFDCVMLKDGTKGTIVDVWEPGSAYEFEPIDHSDLNDGAPLTYAIRHDDITELIYKVQGNAS